MDKAQLAAEFSVSFQYEDTAYQALDQAEGKIQKGSCVVLCGGSGCGKSTLLRCLNLLIPQFYEGELRGFCQVQGQDTASLSIGEMGKLAASVFQDPRSQFFTLNSSTEIAFGLENFGLSHAEMVKRVDEAFERFHLQRLRDRPVFELSSGERQLIALAAAWAMDTDIFLLDEPTANLDEGATQKLRALLVSLKAQGKTLIISEHRLSYLMGLGDVFWRMDRGRIAASYSGAEMGAFSENEMHAMGLRAAAGERIQMERLPRPLIPPAAKTFSVKDLSFSYQKGSKKILNQLTVTGRTGEVIGLTGPNGCGKTTFGKLAAGLLPKQQGSFLWNGQPLREKQLQQNCIFIMQEAEFQFFTDSVWHELHYGLPGAKEKEGEMQRLMEMTGLWEYRDQHPFSLSGGQMQKLVLLLAVLSPKPMVILDEPTAGLDYRSLESCAKLIEEMRRTKLIWIITHDPELLALSCTRGIAIREGKICGDFDLTQAGKFSLLRQEMQRARKEKQAEEEKTVRIKLAKMHRSLDPRAKLLLFLTAMIAGVWTNLPLMLGVFMALLLGALYEGQWKLLGAGGGMMGLIFLLYFFFPTPAFAFIVSFFPRVILIGTGACLLIGRDQAPGILAALRKMRVPERMIMICSVVFRFFPVLKKDMGIMNQSIRTRGFFTTFGEKLRALPEYLEIRIVPMVFRVIRIAEALSASAETRGIALTGKRESYEALKWGAADSVMMVLLAGFIAAALSI